MAQHAVGSRISLISKSDIRYEGFLNFIDAKENTVGLKNVRMYGTEGRKGGNGEIPAGNQLYEYIVFRGADIKDLTVFEDQPPDPAIISATPAGNAGNHNGGGKKDPSNAWHQNRDHANAGRGRGGQQGGRGGQQQQGGRGGQQGGRGGYGGQQQQQQGGARGRGFSDRSSAGGAGGQQQQQQQQQARGPRLEHTGREFVAMEGQGKQEFKEDFDFTKPANLSEAAADKPAVKKAYDKTSSFFDNLSNDVSDRKDRARGQAFREQQKKVDTDTFGSDFVGQHANTRYRRSGRGRGRYGGGGGAAPGGAPRN